MPLSVNEIVGVIHYLLYLLYIRVSISAAWTIREQTGPLSPTYFWAPHFGPRNKPAFNEPV